MNADVDGRVKKVKDLARFHANATLLPTGEVLISGGKTAGRSDITKDSETTVDPTTMKPLGAVLIGEIFDSLLGNDPVTMQPLPKWRLAAKAQYVVGGNPVHTFRDYHSVALLMPDGRVWHGGGSPNTATGPDRQELRVDLYEPWYFTSTRPLIKAMTGRADPLYPKAPMLNVRGRLSVTVEHYRDIREFVLLRSGSVTHSFHSDQRHVRLRASMVSKTQLSVSPPRFRFEFDLEAPPTSNIAPPGNYLLFALDDRRVPSVGCFVRVDREFVADLQQEAEDPTSTFVIDPCGFSKLEPQERKTCASLSFSTPGKLVFAIRPTKAGGGAGPPFNSPAAVIEYGGVDFGYATGFSPGFLGLGAVKKVSAFVSTTSSSLGMDVTLDRPDGPRIASFNFAPTNGAFVEQIVPLTFPFPLLGVNGVHNVFIILRSDLFTTRGTAVLDWFRFKR